MKPMEGAVLVRGSDLSQVEINRLVPYYLMSSYLYYEHDVNIFTDHEFDAICVRLLNEFDNITHMHKHLLDKDSLRAGTGYDLKYTNMVKHAAIQWYETVMNNHNKNRQRLLIGGTDV